MKIILNNENNWEMLIVNITILNYTQCIAPVNGKTSYAVIRNINYCWSFVRAMHVMQCYEMWCVISGNTHPNQKMQKFTAVCLWVSVCVRKGEMRWAMLREIALKVRSLFSCYYSMILCLYQTLGTFTQYVCVSMHLCPYIYIYNNIYCIWRVCMCMSCMWVSSHSSFSCTKKHHLTAAFAQRIFLGAYIAY